MLRTAAHDVHLHVFTLGSSEIDRLVAFRDWLRADDADRELYASTKRSLAEQDWATMQHYADAKSDIVEAILVSAASITTVDGGANGRTSCARSCGASLTPASEDEDQQRDDCEHHQDNDQDSHRRKLPPRAEGLNVASHGYVRAGEVCALTVGPSPDRPRAGVDYQRSRSAWVRQYR